MANKITGRIIVLTPCETLTSRSGTAYQKREVVIERTVFDRNTGQPATDPNDTPIFRLIGAQAADLDDMAVGDMVTVHYELEGRSYIKDGVKAYFTDVRVFRIEPAQRPAVPTPETPARQQPGFGGFDTDKLPYATPVSGSDMRQAARVEDGLPF